MEDLTKMKRKDIIYNQLLEMPMNEGMDAQTLSNLLNISRANISHELNNLCREGKIYKTSGRPVLFFPTKNNSTQNPASKFETLLKYNISLKHALEQAKASILYPPKGMHCLLFGETGVGKSMFAKVMYEYAVEMGVKPKGAPFVTLNCADYSHNPQLLAVQLFGVKKGTYTGAETNKIGLVEKADGGILFLDEVHRLPPEGQEALFIFLDKGTFCRIGDDEIRKSDVLLIFATTENPKSTLLQTFTRRIPMMVTIPSLRERTLEERLYLIQSFFKHESIRVNRDIYVSLNTMRAFLSYNCPNNIGQLTSDIQLVCAKAYSEFLTNLKNSVRISSRSLPLYIKEGLCKETEHRILWNKLVGKDIEYFIFSPASTSDPNIDTAKNNSIYEIIEQKLENLKSRGIADIDIENILEKDISRYFEKYISGISEEINKKNLFNILGEDVLDFIDKVTYQIVVALGKKLSPNIYTALALHINTLINRVSNNKPIFNPQLQKIKQMYPKEFQIAFAAKTLIEEYLHRPIPNDEAGYLTIFLVPEEHYTACADKVKIILIAHGQTTATSMAEVTNELLGENYVIGINSPITVSPSIILEKVKTVIENTKTSRGYLLMVDMGSLTTFADTIEKELNIPIKAFPLTSTLHVIEAARKALLGFSLEEIYRDVFLINSYMYQTDIVIEPSDEKKKIVIVTACLTGEGGSIAIKNFLNKSLRYDKEIFEILPFNCLDKKFFKEQLIKLQIEQEVLFIVSSFSVDLGIKQYNLYDVLSMKVLNELQESVDNKTVLLKMGLILKEHVDNINGEELYHDITFTIKRIEAKVSVKLSDESLIGIILHLGCTISRLKKGEHAVEYPDKEDFILTNQDIYNSIKESLIFFYSKYLIEISENEICYIMNFFIKYNYEEFNSHKLASYPTPLEPPQIMM